MLELDLSYNEVMKSTSCLLLGLSLALFLPTVTYGQKPWDVEQIFLATNETEVRFVNEKGNTVTSLSQETISEKFSMYGMGFRKSAATGQFSSLRQAVHLMPLPENLVGRELSLLTLP